MNLLTPIPLKHVDAHDFDEMFYKKDGRYIEVWDYGINFGFILLEGGKSIVSDEDTIVYVR